MATIVTRSGKGSALTHTEMDANFTNLNNDKPDVIGTPATNNVATFDANADVQDGGYSFPNANAAINSSDEELNFSVGVTSLLQTQMDTKPIGIFSITGTVAASALTVGLNATHLHFRSATITEGVSVARTATSALSLVIPNTATLGTTSTVASRLYLIAIDNAGTVELAIINSTAIGLLTEDTLITTVAVGTGSDDLDVYYSTTARTNVAYRIVGYLDSTQTTAGTWDTAPSALQGYGGTVLLGSLGSLAQVDQISGNEMADYTTGTDVLVQALTERTTTSASYVKLKEITVPTNGTLTIDFDLRTGNPAAAAYGRIYIDGVAVGTERSTTGVSYTTYSESITVVSGEAIQLYAHTTGANTCYIQSFIFYWDKSVQETVVVTD